MKKICNYILLILSSIVLFACAKTSTVVNTTVYCSSVNFAQDLKTSGIVMYVGDICVIESDDITLLPTNCTVGYTLVSDNSSVIVVSNNTVTAIGEGCTNLRVCALSSAEHYVSDEIEVTILPVPVYAQSCQIVGATTNDLMFYVGAQGTFGLSFNPTNYNCGYAFASNSNCFSVDNAGNYQANSVGVATLTIAYKTGENEQNSVQYNVCVVSKPTELQVEYSTSDFYATFDDMLVDANYSLTVTSDVDFVATDLNYIDLQGASVISKQIDSGAVIINFYFESSGETNLVTRLTLASFDCNEVLTNTDGVVVYDYITTLNVSSSPVSITDNAITLNMCNEGEHINSTYLTITYNNMATSRGISVSVANGTIASYNNGTVTAVAAGTTTLTISSIDEYLSNYVLTINVLECLIESIDVSFDSLDLFVGYSLDCYANSSAVTIGILPQCATEQPVIVTSTGLSYNNGQISATSSGQYTFTISSTNCTEQVFEVNVYDLPDELQVKYDNADIADQTLNMQTGTIVEIEYLCMFDGSATDYTYPVQILCDNTSVTIDQSKVNKYAFVCSSDALVNFTVKFGSIEVHFAINFTT